MPKRFRKKSFRRRKIFRRKRFRGNRSLRMRKHYDGAYDAKCSINVPV